MRSKTKKFLANENAVVSIEFMIIAPVMIALYLIILDLREAYTAMIKMHDAKAIVSDIVSRASDDPTNPNYMQATYIDAAEAAAELYMAPLDISGGRLKFTVSSILQKDDGDIEFGWSDHMNGGVSSYPIGGAAPDLVPGANDGGLFDAPGHAVVYTEISYAVQTVTGAMLARLMGWGGGGAYNFRGVHVSPMRGSSSCVEHADIPGSTCDPAT
jgi:hypothetical protein